ncbi:cysteine--tRNA ligase [Methylobacterium sp. WL69]|uniref:cysteine--tRNA ligase n=1 Tax=Methylobacterium sp. WL69 TaxID=2603893 RepID=UPI0011C8B407|nr:cysteine--tRNA ligase [Methylobacterium sp. WL69]TXM69490.1 cysteine--tRNA ligase [Methylobacterium sp. WL69]
MAPMLRLYNTLTRQKAVFAPIDPSHVRMYACGPTVYDAAHIGNARPIIVFDLLFRLLRHLYGPAHVTYARNVTDVDDKINARAAARGITIRELTDGTLAAFHDDIRRLGVLMPEDVNVAGARPRFVEPRATDHIAEMIAIIEGLVAAGHAYVAAGHVLFDVPSMPDYGGLSKRPLDEMEAGARVEVAPYKRSPLDFVLWKPSKPGEPSWPSPCGVAEPGRPGWHIECSAMSWKHLGQTFDIHAGGIDLIFPHHENEVAQSRCCFGTDVMAHVWLHNGFLQVEGEKMSKSLGNFITIRDVLKDWPGEVVRLAMLRTHYRQPIDWTLRGLEESRRTLDGWFKSIGGTEISQRFGAPSEEVIGKLYDDLNFPAAFAAMSSLAKSAKEDNVSAISLSRTLHFFGFDQGIDRIARAMKKEIEVSDEQTKYAGDVRWGSISNLREKGFDFTKLNNLIDRRNNARLTKNWAESDQIRTEIKTLGIVLKDSKDGTTTWTVE